jgi:hypothetical protein
VQEIRPKSAKTGIDHRHQELANFDENFFLAEGKPFLFSELRLGDKY